MQAQRLGTARGHRIQHHGERGDMVQVRMGEEDVVHRLHFIQGEVAHTRTCVDEDAPVNQERGGAAVPRDGARTTEHAHLHGGVALLFGVEMGCPIPVWIVG